MIIIINNKWSTVCQVEQSPPRPITQDKQHIGRGQFLDGWPRFFSTVSSCDRLGDELPSYNWAGGVDKYSLDV